MTVATIPSPATVLKDSELFARYFCWILDKEKRLVPLRYNKAQRHFMQHRTKRSLILKARQLGFSTAIQADLFRVAVTRTSTTMTMAHDSDTTSKLRRMQDRFWEHCRFGNLQPQRKYANSSLISYPEFDSTSIIATAGSKEAGRGDTYTHFHGSEVAFWPDAEKILAGAMQGGDPSVVLESTPNGAQGWFYDRCLEAMENRGEWQLFFYPWWWDESYQDSFERPEERDDFARSLTREEFVLQQLRHLSLEQIKWRRRKQSELKRLFIQEYPEDPLSCFLTSGNSYFGDLTDVFTAPATPVYTEGHRYYGGLDFGQSNDFTALSIIDFTTLEQVELLRLNKMSWGDIRRRVAERYRYWHLPLIVAEENSIGAVNIEELQKLDVVIVPFETTNASKAEGMASLHESIHERHMKLLPNEIEKREFQVFVASQLPSGLWRLAAEGEEHDDTVLATMMANHAGTSPAVAILEHYKNLANKGKQSNA